MLHIAVVEDVPEDADILISHLQRYEKEKNIQLQIEYFSNGLNFLDEYIPFYQIIFLDIEMPFLDGISIARKLRQLDKSVCLIFVTNVAKYAINGYEVSALDFLLKPLQYFYFASKMDRAVWSCLLRSKNFVGLDTDKGVIKMAVSSIIFIESDKHYVIIHTDQAETYRCRDTIKGILPRFSTDIIVRCHISYLVNMDYIIRVERGKVFLPGIVLPISRSCKKSFMDAFTKYLGGGCR